MAHQAKPEMNAIPAPGDAHKGQRLIITPEDSLDNAQASGEWIGAERVLDLNECQ